MAEGHGSAFVGGVLGAIATALVGGGVVFLTNAGNVASTLALNSAVDSILNHLDVRLPPRRIYE
jgi:hypothetical protein